MFEKYTFKHLSEKRITKLIEKYELLTLDNLKHRFEKLLRSTLLYNDKGARDKAAILYLNADVNVKNELDGISKEIIEIEMIGIFFLIIGILIPVVTYLFSRYLGWTAISWAMLIFGLVMIAMSANPRSNAKKLSRTNLSKEEFNRIVKEYYKDDFDEKF